MITRLSHATFYVLDQNAARNFYVDKLGFEVRMDQKMDNGFRWLTVGPKTQPDLNIILMQVDGPNMQPEIAAALKEILAQGKLPGSSRWMTAVKRTTNSLPKAWNSSNRRPGAPTESRLS